MSKTVYIARNAQILAALSDDEYSDGVIHCRGNAVDCAPYYAEKPLREWEADALQVFSDYVLDVRLDGDWEYNGSSSYDDSDSGNDMTVAVYESPIGDFADDQLDALVAHPATIFHGYVEFVDQKERYARFLIDLADLAEICRASRIDKLRVAVGDVLDESREHYDPVDDIRDALRGSDWDYVDGDLALRVSEAA
ncbi:hypothetical protein HFO84_35610 [Rhizobium leguminosarum]|uniref:hypothetical protein n=1 Tax=Rhizobium leguminosarum TaxID=384 RepID=UPI001C97E0CD|nr:hypothetical protein [Rhizobium leguminosarum]MBY5482600.1 hypothetical protein [Rhizobium leguminosarum]